MTFDEWYSENLPSLPENRKECYYLCRTIWDLAINEAINHLNDGGWSWNDEWGYFSPSERPACFEEFPGDELKKLLTS